MNYTDGNDGSQQIYYTILEKQHGGGEVDPVNIVTNAVQTGDFSILIALFLILVALIGVISMLFAKKYNPAFNIKVSANNAFNYIKESTKAKMITAVVFCIMLITCLCVCFNENAHADTNDEIDHCLSPALYANAFLDIEKGTIETEVVNISSHFDRTILGNLRVVSFSGDPTFEGCQWKVYANNELIYDHYRVPASCPAPNGYYCNFDKNVQIKIVLEGLDVEKAKRFINADGFSLEVHYFDNDYYPSHDRLDAYIDGLKINKAEEFSKLCTENNWHEESENVYFNSSISQGEYLDKYINFWNELVWDEVLIPEDTNKKFYGFSVDSSSQGNKVRFYSWKDGLAISPILLIDEQMIECTYLFTNCDLTDYGKELAKEQGWDVYYTIYSSYFGWTVAVRKTLPFNTPIHELNSLWNEKTYKSNTVGFAYWEFDSGYVGQIGLDRFENSLGNNQSIYNHVDGYVCYEDGTPARNFGVSLQIDEVIRAGYGTYMPTLVQTDNDGHYSLNILRGISGFITFGNDEQQELVKGYAADGFKITATENITLPTVIAKKAVKIKVQIDGPLNPLYPGVSFIYKDENGEQHNFYGNQDNVITLWPSITGQIIIEPDNYVYESNVFTSPDSGEKNVTLTIKGTKEKNVVINGHLTEKGKSVADKKIYFLAGTDSDFVIFGTSTTDAQGNFTMSTYYGESGVFAVDSPAGSEFPYNICSELEYIPSVGVNNIEVDIPEFIDRPFSPPETEPGTEISDETKVENSVDEKAEASDVDEQAINDDTEKTSVLEEIEQLVSGNSEMNDIVGEAADAFTNFNVILFMCYILFI